MDPFDAAMAFTLRWEGGWVDDPADPGLETYRGISRRAHPDWDGWPLVDALADKDAPDLPLEVKVRAFYREHYWEPIAGDALPGPLAVAVFDWAVHSGVTRAAIALQTMIGATPDGKIGPATIAAAHRYAGSLAARELLAARRVFLTGLIESRPTLGKFSGGWSNRLDALAREVA